MRLVALVALYLGLCALLPPAGVAFAADERPPPTKEQKREAAKKFKEGEKAFLKNDFVNAATAFEAAYEIAPHPDVLINAVDAHEKAGNLPRAATLCARVLKNPQNDRVRSDMQARLARLTPKIGRIEIAAPASTTEIKLDGGEAPLGELLYVDPGDHRASGRIDGVLVEKAVNVVAGARATVTLEAPDEEESEGGSGSGGSKKPPEDDDEKPLHPAFFFVGVGLTCVSAGILTLERRRHALGARRVRQEPHRRGALERREQAAPHQRDDRRHRSARRRDRGHRDLRRRVGRGHRHDRQGVDDTGRRRAHGDVPMMPPGPGQRPPRGSIPGAPSTIERPITSPTGSNRQLATVWGGGPNPGGTPPPPQVASETPHTPISLTPGHDPGSGRYEMLLEIASGGMGSVFVGRMRGAAGFERLVAIKRMHPHLANEEQFWFAFQEEARIASLIRHPNVVNVIDVYEEAGERLLVMEYVEGVSASTLVNEARKSGQRLSRHAVLRICIDALHGLHAAHELHSLEGTPLHVVHRDVSPQNVLVGADGTSRLTDFGIARAVERLVHTSTSQLKGKLRYMAPEQARGEPLDRRADIFSLGIVLWEMLTLRRLYQGESDVEILFAAASSRIPSPRQFDPTIAPALEAIVLRALSPDPNLRFATAGELAAALEGYAWESRELASHQDIASLVHTLVGERLVVRQRAIQEALAFKRSMVARAAVLPPHLQGMIASSHPSGATPATGMTAQVTARPPGSRNGAIAAIAATGFGVAMLAGGLVAYLYFRDPPKPTPGSATATDVTTVQTSGAKAEGADRVLVELQSTSAIREVRGPGLANIKFDANGTSFEVVRSETALDVVVVFESGDERPVTIIPRENIGLRVSPSTPTASATTAPVPTIGGRPGTVRPPVTSTSTPDEPPAVPGLRKSPYEDD